MDEVLADLPTVPIVPMREILRHANASMARNSDALEQLEEL